MTATQEPGAGLEERSYRSELEAVRAQLMAAIEEANVPDVRAYAALRRDGELHPYTDEAEDIWIAAPAGDAWRAQHCAIVLHARAYDLEAIGSNDAFVYWQEALAAWARLCDDDGFWHGLTAHVGECMGRPLDDEIVRRVRRALPAHLLSVHATLIGEYRGRDQDRAREHMVTIKRAPFPEPVREDVRRRLVQPAIDAALKGVETATFAEGIRDLQSWLEVDEDNPQLVRTLLYVCRTWSEKLWNLDDWAQIRANTKAAEDAVKALGEDTVGEALTAELARHHYWHGAASFFEARDVFDMEASQRVRDKTRRLASRAVEQLERAEKLDPQLGLDAFYRDARMLEAHAHVMCGLCHMANAVKGKREEFTAAVKRFREAIATDADVVPAHLYLAQALLGREELGEGELVEAEQAIENADRLTAASGETAMKEQVEQLRQFLAFRKMMGSAAPASAEPDLGELLRLLGELVEAEAEPRCYWADAGGCRGDGRGVYRDADGDPVCAGCTAAGRSPGPIRTPDGRIVRKD